MRRGSYAGLFSPLPTRSRVVVDANVLLNSIFLPDGFARKAVSALSAMEKVGLIDDSIDLECRRRIRLLATKFGVGKNRIDELIGIFDEQAPRLVPLRLPPAEVTSCMRSALIGQENDLHVASACVGHDAWLLTSDANLAKASMSLDIEVRSPWDVVAEAADCADDPVAMDHMFRFVAPTQDQGFIFAHVLPGDWADKQGTDTFTVCDVGGLGSLFYEQRRRRWVSEGLGSSIARANPMVPRAVYSVCASYKFRSERKGHASIYVGSPGAEAVQPSSCEIRKPRQLTLSTIRYGAKRSGDDAWFGHLRWVAIGPQSVSARYFQTLLSIPNAIPDPHDWKMLEFAIRNAGTRPLASGRIQFASETDIVRYGRE